jgi:hypothetical protein
MRFSKQRFVIFILFFTLPLVTALAFLQTPMVSEFVLQFALRVARFRTGLQVSAKSWEVGLFNFSASLKDVQVRISYLKVECPVIDMRISPISLLWGELNVRSLELNQAKIKGDLQEWNVPNNSKSSSTNLQWSEGPEIIGEGLKDLNRLLASHNLSFDRIKFESAQFDLKLFSVSNLNFDFENYGDGQARIQWKIENADLPNYLSGLQQFEGSFVVLKGSQKRYDMIIPRVALKLGVQKVSEYELTGRWPGELNFRAQVELADLQTIFKTNVSVLGQLPKVLAGRVEIESRQTLLTTGFQKYSGSVGLKNILINDYNPNDLSFRVDGDMKSTSVTQIALQLPSDLGDLPAWNQRIFSEKIMIDHEQKIFSGRLNFDGAGLCSVLRAASVLECPVSLQINGVSDFVGTSSPFTMKATPMFQVTDTLVDGVEIPNYPSAKPLVRVRPFKLDAAVEINSKGLDILNAKINWNGKSEAFTEGRIEFDPIVLSLKSYGEQIDLRDMVSEFIAVQPEGRGRLNADIFYDEKRSREQGRTDVEARVSLDDIGLEKQYFGLLTGPASYKNNKLILGPFKLSRGGGRATINGELIETANGPWFKIGAELDRIEFHNRIEGMQKDLFKGFVSGSIKLEGSTNSSRDDFLKGPLDLKANAFSFLGIPFQKASGRAVYEKQVLSVSQFVLENREAKLNLSGELRPIKDTEINFSTESFPISFLKINSGLNELQDGKLQVKGFWKPAVGWGVAGSVFDLKNGGRKFPEGSIRLGGDSNEFHLDFKMGDLLKLSYRDQVNSLGETKIQKVNTAIKDEGFYALFSFMKNWKNEVPVRTRGQLALNWTPVEGNLKINGLSIEGPSRRDGRIARLLGIPGEKVFSWEKGILLKNTFDPEVKESAQFLVLKGDPGQKSAKIEARIPAPFLDLLVPNLNFIEGNLSFDGTIPLNPDLNTLQLKGFIKDTILLVRGLGKPVEDLSSEVVVAGNNLFLNRARGRLGSGEVLGSGVYKLDIEKPGTDFQFNLNRSQLVLMDDVPLDVSGEVFIKGEQLPYELAGRVQVSNAVYSKEFGNEVTLIDSNTLPVLNYALDVDLGQDVRVKNTVSDLLVNGKVFLTGNDLSPQIKGKIQIGTGQVFANDTAFQITQGAVDFPGGYPIVPLINLQATTQVKSEDSDYKIDLKVRGSSENLSFDFTSEPNLDTSQIVNLLAFGMVRRNDDSLSVGSDLAGAARVEAFQALFGKALGKNINSTTGFQVRFRAAPDQSQKEFIPKVMVSRRLTDRVTATFGNSLDIAKPEKNFQVDYKLFNNVNLTGVWEQGSNPQDSSLGMDLRFKFNLK